MTLLRNPFVQYCTRSFGGSLQNIMSIQTVFIKHAQIKEFAATLSDQCVICLFLPEHCYLIHYTLKHYQIKSSIETIAYSV